MEAQVYGMAWHVDDVIVGGAKEPGSSGLSMGPTMDGA